MLSSELEDKILGYADLSHPAQAALQKEVAENVVAESLLKSVRRLDKQLSLARPTQEDRMLNLIMSPTNQTPKNITLQKEIDLNPKLKSQYETLSLEYHELTKELNPQSHFESLVGYSLDSTETPLTQKTQRQKTQPQEGKVRNRAQDRPALRLVRSITSIRRLSLAATILIGSYLILFLASTFTQSPINEMASVDVFQNELIAPVFRGENHDVASIDAIYYRALSLISAANNTTLGLFPQYDGNKLVEAKDLLQGVIQAEAGGDRLTPLSLNAHFFLGKVWLGLNEPVQARIVLGTVAVAGGIKSEEAISLVAQLEVLGY